MTLAERQRTLNDYIKVYNHDTAAIYAAVSSLDGWRKHSWYNATTGQSHSEATKELDVCSPGRDWSHMVACEQIVQQSLKAYADELMPFATIHHASPIRLNRYNTGTMMRIHSDHIHSLFDGHFKGLPAVSLVANLNDDYEGGEFVICGETLPLKAGDVVVFPSCFLYPHEVKEVTAGTRYSFVSWAW